MNILKVYNKIFYDYFLTSSYINMNILNKILIITLLFISFNLSAQNLPDNINDCFKKGESSLISENLASKVNLIIPGTNDEIDKIDVVQKLNMFFSSHKPDSYIRQHKSEKGNSGFSIGKLTTNKGTYRVHLLFRLEDNIYLINQIRIDKLNE